MGNNYHKLRYEQYFIDTSGDVNKKGTATFKIEYKSIDYVYNGVLTHANYYTRYDEKRNVIQVHFEGTKDFSDWCTNLTFVPKYYESFMWEDKKITLKVHKSWATMYKVMKDFVRKEVSEFKELHNEAEIEVIGWSLGSAMAMLCAQDLNYNFGYKTHLFTFGSVNLFKTNMFNRKLTKKYLRSTVSEYHIFAHRNDMVSYLVPRIFGFVKLSRLNVKGKFNIFSLFNIAKYHFHYDEHSYYVNIYKKEKEA